MLGLSNDSAQLRDEILLLKKALLEIKADNSIGHLTPPGEQDIEPPLRTAQLPIKDSFSSYYRETIKPKSALLSELQTLKLANTKLRSQLKKLPLPRNQPRPKTSRTPREIQQIIKSSALKSSIRRLQNCKYCDLLLSKGCSTKLCQRHTNKS